MAPVEVVATWPPIPDDVCDRIAALLADEQVAA